MRVLTLAAAAAVVLAGCAPLTSRSHVELPAGFDGYVTYDWGPRDVFATSDPRLDHSAIFEDSLQGTIERQLARKPVVAGPP